MKIRIKQREYEAIRFKDEIEVCHNIQEFVKDKARLICEPGKKILSTFAGNYLLKDGDIIYLDENGFCFVAANDNTLDSYFEILE